MYLHRIVYVGTHNFCDNLTVKEFFKGIIRKVKAEEFGEVLTGFLPCYQHIFIFILLLILLFTAVSLLPGGSGFFRCIQNTKLVTTRFKSGGIHEKHVVATWKFGNHFSICF